MSIITLTSDWGRNDLYKSIIKGKILSSCPSAQIIDISHKIQPFNKAQTAFTIKNTYKYFPKNSVHIIAVNSENYKEIKHIVVKYDDQYFIGADNGVFSLIFERKPEYIVHIENEETNSNPTFPESTLFVDIACQLITNIDIKELGTKVEKLDKTIPLLPVSDKNTINGHILFIDNYRNIITNITKELFESVRKKRDFVIYIQSFHNKITKINKYYQENSPAELLAIFNSMGYLEIAMHKANAAQLLSLDSSSTIRIKFNTEK